MLRSVQPDTGLPQPTEIVYRVISTPEFANPILVAIALIVVVAATLIAVEYVVLPPSQVPITVAPGILPSRV